MLSQTDEPDLNIRVAKEGVGGEIKRKVDHHHLHPPTKKRNQRNPAKSKPMTGWLKKLHFTSNMRSSI